MRVHYLGQILLVLLSYQCVQAWWETGHMAIAEIAKQEMLKVNPKLYKLIEKLSYYGGDLSNVFYNHFQYTSIWADDIKSEGFQMYDEWHYIDLPINDQGLLINLDHKSTSNALWAIDKLTACLNKTRTLNTISIEKGQMLRFLIHIIGDIHQPLHATSLYNDVFSTELGDDGGTKYTIQYNLTDKKISSLHFLWDSGAGLLPDYHGSLFNEQAFEWVENYSRELIKRFTREKLQKELNLTEPKQWVQESYQLAREKVYKPLNGSNIITVEYRDQAFQLIEQRIAVGGYRLADYLLKVFKNYNVDLFEEHEQKMKNTKKNYNLRGTSII